MRLGPGRRRGKAGSFSRRERWHARRIDGEGPWLVDSFGCLSTMSGARALW